MATKDELIAKATELGITLTGEETMANIGELIKVKVEEKRLIDEAEAKKAAEAEEARIKREADDEAALQKESERVRKEQEEKALALKKDREAAQGTQDQERKYTEADVKAMLKQALAEMRAQGDTAFDDPNNLDDDDPYKQKQVRLPRFQNKFVMAFKNTNTDEYFPELVIHAFDVWNDQIKRNEPWVTAIFDDGSELTIRLETIITKSQKIWVDLVERTEVDKSFSQGKVEVSEVKDYSRSGTGAYRKLKVTQAEYSYKLRLPHTGKEVIVGREVINW